MSNILNVSVGLTAVDDSNLFLRSLWAELRKNFSNFGWLLQPYKDGEKKQIYLGLLDLGISTGPLEISLDYKERGSIKSISFKFSDKENINLNTELCKLLTDSVDNGLKNRKQPSDFFLKSYIKNLHVSLANYSDSSFTIEKVSPQCSALTIKVKAFDKKDADPEFLLKVNQFLDVLSIETNIPFWIAKEVDENINENIPLNQYISNQDWLEDYPVKDNFLLISEKGKNLLNLIGNNETTEEISTLLLSCKHFHSARKLDAQVSDKLVVNKVENISENEFSVVFAERDNHLNIAYEMGQAQNEIITVLYISSLEVAANINNESPSSCDCCGQPKYRIRQRVVDLVNKSFPEGYAGKIIKDVYDKRSKYLHAGVFLTDVIYTSPSNPQLSVSSSTGVTNTNVSHIFVRECSSYCLRKVLQDIV